MYTLLNPHSICAAAFEELCTNNYINSFCEPRSDSHSFIARSANGRTTSAEFYLQKECDGLPEEEHYYTIRTIYADLCDDGLDVPSEDIYRAGNTLESIERAMRVAQSDLLNKYMRQENDEVLIEDTAGDKSIMFHIPAAREIVKALVENIGDNCDKSEEIPCLTYFNGKEDFDVKFQLEKTTSFYSPYILNVLYDDFRQEVADAPSEKICYAIDAIDLDYVLMNVNQRLMDTIHYCRNLVFLSKQDNVKEKEPYGRKQISKAVERD